MNVDAKIKLLEEEIARLKMTKNIDDSILTKSGDFKIKIYNAKNEEKCIFSTFKEVFDFMESHMNKTDHIFLDSYNNATKKWDKFTADTEDEFLNLIKEISTYDAYRITTMDFGVCKRNDQFKYMVYIENDFLKFFYDLINEPVEQLKTKMTQDDYWKKINEGRKYHLKFD